MKTGRPKTPIILNAEDQSRLNVVANLRSLSHGLVTGSCPEQFAIWFEKAIQ